MKQLVTCSIVFLLALALPSAALAGSELDDKKAKWVGEYQELQARHVQLKADLDQARVDYSRGRSTQYLRGEGKPGLLKEIARLEQELAAVSTELEEFPDKARKDGAFPGWFRDLQPPEPAAPQPPAATLEGSEDDESSPSQSRADKRNAEREKRRRR